MKIYKKLSKKVWKNKPITTNVIYNIIEKKISFPSLDKEIDAQKETFRLTSESNKNDFNIKRKKIFGKEKTI